MNCLVNLIESPKLHQIAVFSPFGRIIHKDEKSATCLGIFI